MNRLDLDDPHVFNRWRDLYNDLTDDEQRDFANACEERFPDQAHANRFAINRVFESHVPARSRVIEIGGWKGELAAHCLKTFFIENWLNIEFCPRAIAATVPALKDEARYETWCPKSFRWFKDVEPRPSVDVVVATHVIEHFSDADFLDLVKRIAGVKWIFFDAPLTEDGERWDNYLGTHKLEMGWYGVRQVMADHGYCMRPIAKGCYLFTTEHE